MIRLLRVALAMAVAGFAAVYFVIGSAFLLEWQPHGAHVSAVFGLFGFIGPLVLLCVHVATLSPDRSLRARRVMLWLYVVVVAIALLGMAPQLYWPETRPGMAELMLKTVVWCCVCGAPILWSWLNAPSGLWPR